jgi:eukaryotic-like serine/threonine-protein kinase
MASGAKFSRIESLEKMALAQGEQLGHYKILSLLGKGGMGEVYRARDVKLGRDVAIKVLPTGLVPDPERLARFEREARVLAALNHPHIAAIYGLEDHAIVMELVEGPTLAERIASGPIPLDECLAIAAQIADGLEAAHEKGIIHRDLKPANVKAPLDGPVKVLDLGLATAMPAAGREDGHSENSPTLTMAAATEAGMILGTAAYMSPEQAAGKRADKRSDIWSFGAVLWEMLVGKRIFVRGETISHTLADVLRSPIDFKKLPASTPASIVELLKRCLDRDVKTRLRDIGEARVAIAKYLAHPGEEEHETSARSGSAMGAWLVAAMFALAAGTLAFVHFREAPTPERAMRMQIALPENASGSNFALSPDGRMLAITAVSGGKSHLWLRPLDAVQPQLMPGTEGATYPFWSPDSRYVAFFAESKLKKILASGGPPQALCDAPEGRGGSWNRDDVILFSSVDGGGFAIQKVSAAGGASAMTVKSPRGIVRYPVFLPNGRNFLYTLTRVSPEENGIYFRSLDGTENRRIVADESTVSYAAGRILFIRENALMAQPFDTDKGQALGDPLQIAAGVSRTTNVVYAPVTVSDTGVLIYEAGGASDAGNQIVRYDRGGKLLETLGAKGGIYNPAFSPDGRSLAFMRLSPSGSDIWLWDVARGSEQRFAKDPAFGWAPVWSPAGDRIGFQSNRAGGITNLYVRPVSGIGQDEPLFLSDSRKTPTQWSHDGRFIVFGEIDSKTRDDIWILPVESGKPGKPFVFLHSESNEEFGQLSPDSHWMAYTSDESGRREVYVRTFPAGEDPKRISIDGGEEPRWRGDGKELYFVGADAKFMAVPLRIGAGAKPSLEPASPQTLFAAPPLSHYTAYTYDYDVTVDGKQFVLATAVDRPGSSLPLNVVLNWDATLKK